MIRILLKSKFCSGRNAFRYKSTSNKSNIVQTIDENEVLHFKSVQDWWSETCPVKGLHAMNSLRVPFVRDGLLNSNQIDPKQLNSAHPLKNLNILDVGCGAGILSEPLTRLGGNVTGIDATKELIDIAIKHSENDNSLKSLTYKHVAIEEHVKDNAEIYDAIVASEVIEHVTEKDIFIENCVNCLKPGGSFFLTTINKTLASQIGGIYIAEYILEILPKGTHDWNKFISPHELQRYLEIHNCRTKLIHGMGYNYFTNTWFWTGSTSICYALHAVKNKD